MPATSGSTPKCAGEKSGAQFVPNRKSTRADLAEELERRHEQRDHDADGRDDADERAPASAMRIAPSPSGGASASAAATAAGAAARRSFADRRCASAVSAFARCESVSGTKRAGGRELAALVDEVVEERLDLGPLRELCLT